ncbi:chondroitinase-B domain-containing protein [Spongiimicrobium sp. 3-5]|uniref:chondroitinase-B domain-containing protein n=1 Tax=Spongiimicrobium sp. 3-5 TaxID=3332596 RepID=UPI00398121A6
MKFSSILNILLFFIIFSSCTSKEQAENLVRNVDEFNAMVAKAGPGDVIRLANGVWQDTELLFEGKGTAEMPITLSVEEKGKVSLEGQSNLRIAGDFLVVEGLVFKNGYTPTTEVISFKKDNSTLANNSRLTECVIDNYTNPERHEPDTWVAIYGKNNRVDHNHLEGKRNRGVTMIVRLNSLESQENMHQIDHNYFGPRPNLGSNGGETLRIGTSHFSLTNSRTMVEANYFDRCNGEHEIISNKSCQNTYKNNVFYECTGTLTMRHGNETLVDGNVFIGNNKPSTGGIRVINGQQTVINNYGIGLTGYRFRGALVVMNGVPNSPINRYFQVEDANISNNTFINCDHIQLCAGSDGERSATPINSVISENIFYNEKKDNVFTVYDDIKGIKFDGNIIGPNSTPISETGFTRATLDLKKNQMGLLVPDNMEIGAKLSNDLATKENTGVLWYPKVDREATLSSGKTISVVAGLNTLFEAAVNSEPGDIIELVSPGPYELTKTISVDHALTFTTKQTEKPIVLFEKKSLFEIRNGGSLALKGLKFDGKLSPDRTGNSVITTSKYSMINNYKLFIDNCDFTNLDVNHSYDAIRVYKNTFADTLSIKNSKFENITGSVVALDQETDDIGIYNAEYVLLNNNSYTNIEGAALRLYRGGKDESTFGPFLQIDHCVFNNVGHGTRNKYKAAISLYGVQETNIKNNIFKESKGINMHLVVGEPIVNVLNNNFFNTEKLTVTGDQKYRIENLWSLDPGFSEENNYGLKGSSSLKGKGTDGLDLGLLKQ